MIHPLTRRVYHQVFQDPRIRHLHFGLELSSWRNPGCTGFADVSVVAGAPHGGGGTMVHLTDSKCTEVRSSDPARGSPELPNQHVHLPHL